MSINDGEEVSSSGSWVGEIWKEDIILSGQLVINKSIYDAVVTTQTMQPNAP